jgi:hypothetical protein
MIACPVKSSEGGLPKAAFNRVKWMIVRTRSYEDKNIRRLVFFLPSHLLISACPVKFFEEKEQGEFNRGHLIPVPCYHS